MGLYLIVAGDFVTTGGMDSANHALAKHLLAEGNEVHLVAYRIDPALLAYPRLRFHKVPKLFGSYFIGGFLIRAVGRFWAGYAGKRSGRVIVNGGNCVRGDVNWVHYVFAAEPPRLLGALGRFKKVFFLARERAAMAAARLVIANSERTKKDIERFYPEAGSRARCVYLGADPERFHPAAPAERDRFKEQLGQPGRDLALFVGDVSDRRKGFEHVYGAWRLLKENGLAVPVLIVAGDRSRAESWRRRADEDGLSGSVLFLGIRKDIGPIMRCCDIMVSPSLYEPFGLAVYESLCCGVPAIVSREAGVAEKYTAPLQGLLLDGPPDDEGVFRRICFWRERRGIIEREAADLSRQLGAYRWEDMARSIERALDEGI